MISICMPYWNRPGELMRSLRAYDKAYPDLDLEFSICDDGSSPPLKIDRPDCKITHLPWHSGALNPCVPINVAVRQASSDIIVLTNPEVEHKSPVFQQMLKELKGPDDYVSASCRNLQRTPIGSVMDTGWIAGPQTRRAPLDGRLPIPPGSELHFCVMFHRELFERAGGFDEAYREGLGCDDNQFLWALHSVGAKFKCVPDVVWHYRTPHKWNGTLEKNKALLEKRYGHLPEYRACV